MMRILLTGVSGQVGQALRNPLRSFGPVIAADRSALDLSCPDRIPTSLDSFSPDLIVNPAAYTAVDQAEDEGELAYRVNAEAPSVMARWAALHGVPMMHYSTDYVFDGTGDRPWREGDPTGPLSVYGASKLAGEAAIRDAGGSHLIIRTSWVFAASGRNFLTTIARLARERQELRIVADQFGAPTSARSIAEGLVAMLSGLSTQEDDSLVEMIKQRFYEADGLVHMSTSGETTWHGFASAIVDGLRARGISLAVKDLVAIESDDFPTKATRPRNSRLDMGRLQSVFGLQMPTWQDALACELDGAAKNILDLSLEP
jgi:dTDP-4-dehydrorhamnose reductase